MKFDSNRAWKEAAASVTANREVLFALAGVFFLLPSLAFGLLMPGPEAAAGMSADEQMALLRGYYADALPWLLPMALLQAIGTLALLTLFTDRSRPTVGQALREAALNLFPYIAAQLLIGMGFVLVGGLLLGLASATGAVPIVALAYALLFAGLLYVLVKASLVAPVVMVERVRSPIASIRRSWALTKGNTARVAVFFLLLLVVALVAMTVIGVVLGLLSAVLAGGEVSKVIDAVASSFIGSVLALYFVAVVAAIHRQLAGASPETIVATFE